MNRETAAKVVGILNLGAPELRAFYENFLNAVVVRLDDQFQAFIGSNDGDVLYGSVQTLEGADDGCIYTPVPADCDEAIRIAFYVVKGVQNWRMEKGAAETPKEENRLWVIEFGVDFEIPEFIDRAVETGAAEDCTWHHDLAPRFVFTQICDGEKRLHICIQHPDKKHRDDPDWRFSFCWVDRDGEFFESGEDIEPYACETAGEAATYIEQKLGVRF